MFRELNEECGVFGIYGTDEKMVVETSHLALYALQHRGRDGAGIAVTDGETIHSYKDLGLVADVFTPSVLKSIKSGKIAIGHVRNSRRAVVERFAAQPLVMRYMKGSMALANNGALVNGYELRCALEHDGAMFQTSGDAEIIAYIVARKRVRSGSLEKAIVEAMDEIQGAYSLVILGRHKLIAARDPRGMRPLSLGKIGNSWVVASETCVFDSLGIDFVRDIKPGEVVMIDENGLHSDTTHCNKQKPSLCIYEYVYFARPDSVINGRSVHGIRLEIGKLLAKEHPVEADIVCGVPDSGISAAIGYSLGSGIPYGTALIKNKYVSQAHLPKDNEEIQKAALKCKLNVLESIIKGKRVILVDDSIIKGMTAQYIISLLKKAGATEVHLRISSPPVFNTCYFGTTINDRGSLITSTMQVNEICKAVDADSLGFVSVDGLHSIDSLGDSGICDACFTGNYPMKIDDGEHYNKYDHKFGEELKD